MSSSAHHAASRRVGTTIGKYTIDSVLGVGGMATVYRATHRNGHKAALKVLARGLAESDDLRRRFVQEAYAANSIDHPGVVHILDDDETEDGSVYLVLELLEGETLETRARRLGGTLAVAEVVTLAIGLLDVLEAAHANGIVHRDIKPANLMLTDAGVLKVLDFGIARMHSAKDPHVAETEAGRAMGTPAFMPPEQALGKQREIDARTDLWATGATMFFLLTGRYVHAAENAASMMVTAATKPAPLIKEVAPATPANLAAVIDQALAFERAARFQSASLMRDALVTLDVATPNVVDRRRRSQSGRESASHQQTVDLHLSTGAGLTAESTRLDVDAKVATPTLLSATPARQTPDAVPAAASAASTARPPETASEIRMPAAATAGERTSPQQSESAPSRRRSHWVPGFVIAGLIAAAATGVLASRPVEPTQPPAAVSPAPSVQPCVRHSECAAQLAENARCHKGACARVARPDCELLGGGPGGSEDHTVLVGAMYRWDSNIASADLARRDITEVTNGLPPIRDGEPRRPLAIISCKADSATEQTARYLVEALGVPIVLGFPQSKEALDLSTAVFQPSGVLALAGNQSTLLTGLPRPAGAPRSLLRVSPSARDFAVSMATLASALGERVSDSTPRVALTRVDNHTGVSYAELFTSTLRIKGRSVPEMGEDFLQVIAPSEAKEFPSEPARDKLLAFKPRIILKTGGLMDLVEAVEKEWPTNEPRPLWIELGGFSAEDIARVSAVQLPREPLEDRMFGIGTSVSHTAMAKYVARYNEVHEKHLTRFEAGSFPYDAVYLSAYLIAARGEGPLDLISLTNVLPRLSSGQKVDVGQAGLHATFATLREGGSIDLEGTITSLDFDPQTGDPKVDLAVFCFARRGAELTTVESKSRDRCTPP